MDHPPVLDLDPPETTALDPDTAIALRRPDVPVTITDLAAHRTTEAVALFEARGRVWETAVLAAIRMTSPEDHLLFKAPDGTVRSYLGEVGCQRVRPLLGITIRNVSDPQKLAGEHGSFMYVIRGDGFCSLTGGRVENVEGGRSSTDEHVRGKTGADLELGVRKAARANLDGRVTRELAGLHSIPVELLERAWQGSTKTVERCTKGRGFGTQQERVGGLPPNAPPTNIVPPKCSVCGATGVHRTSTRGAFWGCPDFKKHEAQKWSIDAAKWAADPASRSVASLPPMPTPGDEDETPMSWR